MAEQAAAAGGFNGNGRRQASMSTGNLVDLYQQHAAQQQQQAAARLGDGRLGGGGLPGGGPGLRGVASSSNIWDAQLPVSNGLSP